MGSTRLASQVIAGTILFTVISVVLEGTYTPEVWFEKVKLGLVFGLVYGMYLWARDRFTKK